MHPVNVTRAIAISTGPVHGLAMTANGSQFLTGADDKTVKLWNTTKGTADQEFGGGHGAGERGRRLEERRAGGNGRSRQDRPDLHSSRRQNDRDDPGPRCNPRAFLQSEQPGPGGGLRQWCSRGMERGFHRRAAAAARFRKAGAKLCPPGVGHRSRLCRRQCDALFRQPRQDGENLEGPCVREQPGRWPMGTWSIRVAFDPTGNRLATGCHDGQLRIWDLTKTPQPAVTKSIVAHATKGQEPGAIYSVAWSPDGKQVLSASFDRTLKLWDPTSGALVREFKAYNAKDFPKGHQQGVFSAAFSPDGKLLVSGGDDRIINIWNTADGSVVRAAGQSQPEGEPARSERPGAQPPQAHPGAIYGVRFIQNGKYILSAGHAPRNQGYLALWNTADGKLVYAAELPTGHINSVSVSTDGKLLAIACAPLSRQSPVVNGYILRMPDAAK